MRIWFSSLGLTLAFVILMASLTPQKPLEPEEVKPDLVVKIFKPIPPPPPPPKPKVEKPPEPIKAKPPEPVKPPPPPKKPPPPKPVPVKVKPPEPKPAPVKTKPTEKPVPKPVVQVKGNKPTPAGGNAGAGAKAAGPEGQKGAPNKPKAPVHQNDSKGNPNTNKPTKSQVQGPGNVEALFSDLGGNISKSMAAGSAGAHQAAQDLRGHGSFTTEGNGGQGQLGSGSGGGGESRNSVGLGKSGLGDGLTGKGLGAIGSGGNLAGSGVGRPSIEVGNASETIVMGGLDKSVIDEYIKRHMSQIRACYVKELEGSKSKLAGRIATRFTISGSGRVSQAGVTSSSIGNAKVEGCLIGVLKRIEFPEPLGGGVVEVDYPFNFTSSVN